MVQDLMDALVMLRTSSEATNFMRDLCTEAELLEMAKRWKVAQLLDKGYPYSDIEKQTSMSTTTIARISKWLSQGMGGYQIMLAKFRRSHHHHATHFSLEKDS